MKTWEDLYALPLSRDEHSNWIYDANENFICQFDDGAEGMEEILLDVINGDISARPKIKFKHEGGIISTELGKEIILIRAWGWLTNVMKLSGKEASNIQDTFAEFLVSKLNGS